MAWRLLTDDGAPIATRFEVAADGDGARVTVSGDVEGAGWVIDLANLSAYVERGLNLRELRRPMLGIGFQPLDAEAAKKRGADTDGGILLDSVVAGSGAEAAGLKAGDVLESIGGVQLREFADLVAVLGPKRAGDMVDTVFWRDGQRQETAVTLGGREEPVVGGDPAALAADITDYARKRLASLEAAFGDSGDVQSGHRPGPDEWSAREVLSHLILGERWAREWPVGAAFGTRSGEYPEGYDDVLRRTLQETSVADAVRMMKEAVLETERVQLGLLRDNGTPPVMRQIAAEIERELDHFEEHMNQIRAAIGAAG
jgi:hypothetical protein